MVFTYKLKSSSTLRVTLEANGITQRYSKLLANNKPHGYGSTSNKGCKEYFAQVFDRKSSNCKQNHAYGEGCNSHIGHFFYKRIQLIGSYKVPLHKLFGINTFRLFAFKNLVNKNIAQNNKTAKASKKAHKLNAPNTQPPRYKSCCDDSQPQRNQKDTCSVVEIGRASLFTSFPRGHFQFSGAFFLTHVRSLLSPKYNRSSYHNSYEFSTKGAK